MEKWYKICGLVVIFFINSPSVFAQKAGNHIVLPKPARLFFSMVPVNFPPRFHTATKKIPQFQKNISLNISPATGMQHYGFFCKAELKTDAVLKVPVRFRLGSLQYCDYMEGKAKR